MNGAAAGGDHEHKGQQHTADLPGAGAHGSKTSVAAAEPAVSVPPSYAAAAGPTSRRPLLATPLPAPLAELGAAEVQLLRRRIAELEGANPEPERHELDRIITGLPPSIAAHFRHFLLLGVTGAGKTTFAKAMTEQKLTGFLGQAAGRQSGMGTSSCTEQIQEYDSEQFDLPAEVSPGKLSLKFMDTVGLGAADKPTSELLPEMVKAIMGSDKIHGAILIHKADRMHRSAFEEDLMDMQRLFNLMQLPSTKVLIVVTHTGQYSQAVRDEYSRQLLDVLNDAKKAGGETGVVEVEECNIVHCNFANWAELNDTHRGLYEATHADEFQKMALKLLAFDAPILPSKAAMNGARIIDDAVHVIIEDMNKDKARRLKKDKTLGCCFC